MTSNVVIYFFFFCFSFLLFVLQKFVASKNVDIGERARGKEVKKTKIEFYSQIHETIAEEQFENLHRVGKSERS